MPRMARLGLVKSVSGARPEGAFADLTLLQAAATRFGTTLSPLQLGQLRAYGELLLAWNERINLTAVTEPAAVQTLHFLDAITLAPLIRQWQLATGVKDATLLDVGSGAGLPGLVLKLVLPELRVTLLDGTGKRVGFLQRVIDELGLRGIGAVHGRAEALGRHHEWRESFDLVTARALARLTLLLEWCLPLNRVGGLTLAPKAGDIAGELAEGRRAADVLGGSVRAPILIQTSELPNRLVVATDKVRATPERYPRAAGLPKRFPLGVSGTSGEPTGSNGGPR